MKDKLQIDSSSSSDEVISSILKELKSWKKEILVDLHKSNENVRQDVIYQSILSQKVLPSDSPLFSITSWSIAPEFALWLHEHIKRHDVKRIVELGSGLSTVVLAATLKENGVGKVLAIEHDPQYFSQTERLLAENGLTDWVELILSPLKTRQINRQNFRWYGIKQKEIQQFLGDEKIDLLLVDGPPGNVHPLSRFPAYPVFKSFMAHDGMVVLDDCARAPEQEILKRWMEIERGKYKQKLLENIRHCPAIFYRSENAISLAPASDAVNILVEVSEKNNVMEISDGSPVLQYVAELVQRKALRAEHAEIIRLRHELHMERELQGWRLDKIHQDAQLEALTQKMRSLGQRVQQLEEVEDRLQTESFKKGEKLEAVQEQLIALDRDRESQLSELHAAASQVDALRAQLEQQSNDNAVILERQRIENESLLERCALLEHHRAEAQQTALNNLKETSGISDDQWDALTAENSQLKRDLSKLQERSDALSGERKELLQRIAAVGAEVSSLRDRLSTATIKLAKSEKVRSEKDAAFDAKLAAEVEAEIMSRDIFALVSAFQREELHLRAELAKAEKKAEKIKNYLSYRLGAVIVENSANPIQWLKIPFKLARAYSEYKSSRKLSLPSSEISDLNLDNIKVSYIQPSYVGLGSRWREFSIDITNSAGPGKRVMLSMLTPKANAGFSAEIQLTSSIIQSWDFKSSSSSSLFQLHTGESRVVDLVGQPHPIYLEIPNIEGGFFSFRMRKLRGSPCIVKVEITSARDSFSTRSKSVSVATDPAASGRSSVQHTGNIITPAINKNGSTGVTIADDIDPSDERFPKPMPNAVMWQAQQLTLKYGPDVGIKFAKTFGRDEVKRASNILAANQEINDEGLWLHRLNSYIEQFPVSPVELHPGSESRFERLYSVSAKKYADGPLVTIIMPCFNAEKTIRHAVKSILGQTWQKLELIIVDDASTDGTWKIIKQLQHLDSRVIAVRNAENVGPYVSKNLALSIAKGKYITGHDADDWAHPDRIAIQTSALLESDGVLKANMAKMLRMTEEGRFVYFTKENKISDDGVLRDAAISTMFETDYFRKNLGHWDCVRFGADSELISRAEKVLGDKFKKLRQLVMLCLDAEGSLTNDPIHGLSKTSGMSPTRKYYKDQWLEWHKTADIGECYMPFPHIPRRFRVPEAAFVPEASIDANIVAHGQFLRAVSVG